MKIIKSKWRRLGRPLPLPRGQSLVETALVLPIIIMLLAGLVEISNLLVTQNRVSTAARVGTSFGASNFTSDELDDNTDWAEEVAFVATNNVTQTLDLDPTRWDIYVIRASIQVSATAPSGFDFREWVDVHGYGNQAVMAQGEWDGLEANLKADVLDAMETNLETAMDPDGLEILATVAYHDRNSILRIPLFDLGEFVRVRGFNVSRLDAQSPFNGCLLVPIAVRFDGFSVYPSNWTGGPLFPEHAASDPINRFPVGNGPSGFEHPNPAETYTVPDSLVFEDPSNFLRNVPGVPVEDARLGYLLLAREQIGAGGFGWLDWDAPPSSQGDLVASLTFPGDYLEVYPGSSVDMDTLSYNDAFGNHIVTGDGNGTLSVGEWVSGSTGNIASADATIIENLRRPLTFIVFDDSVGTGSNRIFRVKGFMVARIIGMSFQGSNKFILIEFVQWNSECERIED